MGNSKLHFKIVDLLVCISPPTLPTSSSSQHSRPSISFYYLIQCTVALQFRTIRTLLATLLASGGNCTLLLSSACVSAKASATDAAFPCLGIVSSSCSPSSSSSAEGCFFARAALYPVASLTNLQKKHQCLKYGRAAASRDCWHCIYQRFAIYNLA